ncbi:MAG: prolipoprotein diacylglyceryl transferase [Ardenticatenia bacterium]|nr:prolipoprotein diacylglyceryl transferase [Ardenticatenia bacterium]
MIPVLTVGGVAVQTRGLVMLLAFWLAFQAIDRAARRVDLAPDDFWNAGLVAFLAGMLGARLGYVVQFWPIYRAAPATALALNVRDMYWPVGVFMGVLVLAGWLYRAGVPLRRAADVLIIGLAVAWAMAGLGALLSGDAYGIPTAMPWGVELWGARRHPVQLYELVAGLGVAAWLWRQLGRRPFDGWLALVGIGLMAAARLVVEAFRATSALVAGEYRLRQIQMWLILLGALALLAWLERRGMSGQSAEVRKEGVS